MEAVDGAEHRGKHTFTQLAKSCAHASADLPHPKFSGKDYTGILDRMETFD